MNELSVIKNAEKNDAESIALLHKKGIPTGFLSAQSLPFLTALYLYLIDSEIVYVAKQKECVIGFVSGTLTTKGLYTRFLKDNFLLLVVFIVKNIFSLSFIKKAVETFLAPKKTSVNDEISELAELLSIVVGEASIGQGLGKKLLQVFEDDLKNKNISEYKVLVGGKLASNGFYARNGFILKKYLELHKGEISHVYVKEIIE